MNENEFIGIGKFVRENGAFVLYAYCAICDEFTRWEPHRSHTIEQYICERCGERVTVDGS